MMQSKVKLPQWVIWMPRSMVFMAILVILLAVEINPRVVKYPRLLVALGVSSSLLLFVALTLALVFVVLLFAGVI